jgi:hypothetical protein
VNADSKQSQRDGESALSRWSRRKLEARQESGRETQPADELPPGSPDETQQALDKDGGETEKPVLTDADMPDIDTLDENSDYSMFMSSGVSDKLRNMALRKLFGAPAFNIRDGLDEYDDDFTSFEKLGDIVTSDMKHRIEMEQQRLREELAEKQQAEADAEPESAELDAIEDEPAADEGEPAETADETLARLDERPAKSARDSKGLPDDEQ